MLPHTKHLRLSLSPSSEAFPARTAPKYHERDAPSPGIRSALCSVGDRIRPPACYRQGEQVKATFTIAVPHSPSCSVNSPATQAVPASALDGSAPAPE